jgi:DNA-3-methyladenine glycosylase I
MKDEVQIIRCPWCNGSELYETYHDTEWGEPMYDDQKLFEMLILEGAQAGLSWMTILKRREGYREAFYDFLPERVARMTEEDETALLQNPKIIRNKLKIKSAIGNAKAFLKVQVEFGSFKTYLWGFVDHKPVYNHFVSLSEVPAKTPLSDRISKDLQKRGFKFVGSTIVYAYLQAVGVVNDHLVDCHKFESVRKPTKR